MPAGLFLNDFTVLDFAFAGADHGVSGDSYYVSAELFGDLDKRQFLLDFSVAKKLLKSLVDETLDHKLLIPSAPFVRITQSGLSLETTDGLYWEYNCPATSYVVLPGREITVAAMEDFLAAEALKRLPANVREARFILRSPPRFQSEANYRYTHGLRYHEGNCQRLFHGHRNPVEVYVKGERAPAWEARLADEWAGAHFVAAETLENRESLDLPLGVRRPNLKGLAEIAYAGSQGKFSGKVPAHRVVLTETEPSIETMSALAANQLRAWGLEEEFRVVTYEGLNKGASFSA